MRSSDQEGSRRDGCNAMFEARAHARSNEAAPAPAPAQKNAAQENALVRAVPAQRAALVPTRPTNAPAPAPTLLNIDGCVELITKITDSSRSTNRPLSRSTNLNKPHMQNLVGADGSKDAANTMAAVAQEDADNAAMQKAASSLRDERQKRAQRVQ